MKLYQGSDWIPPFASQINCINTIDGYCPRGLTLEDCVQRCQDNKMCAAGYFVEVDRPGQNNPPSYCVPLNTTSWENTNVWDLLIPSKNPTRLSSDKGVRSTMFYDETKFPKERPSNFEKWIEAGSGIFMCFRGKDGTTRYITYDLGVTEEKKSANLMIIRKTGQSIYPYFENGITYLHSIQFSLNDPETSLLNYNKKTNKFHWIASVPNKTYFQFFLPNRKDYNPWINEGILFYLYEPDRNQYLTIQNNRLGYSSELPPFQFYFEKAEPNSIIKNLFYDRINQFLIDSYPDATKPLPTPFNFSKMIIIVCVVLIFLVWCWIIYRLVKQY